MDFFDILKTIKQIIRPISIRKGDKYNYSFKLAVYTWGNLAPMKSILGHSRIYLFCFKIHDENIKEERTTMKTQYSDIILLEKTVLRVLKE